MVTNSFSRRDFLRVSAVQADDSTVAQVVPLQPEEKNSTLFTLQGGLNPYKGTWGREQAAHLLRRATFGCSYKQIEQLYLMGNAQKAVEYLLNVPTGDPAPPINDYNNEGFTDPDIAPGQTWINAPRNLEAEFPRITSWRGWWINRMINAEANIQEKLILFWHNHFSTRTDNSFSGQACYLHHMTLRRHALGDFKQLVYEITLDPHMLFFLNGALNSVDVPDENYARELQELFTIGKDNPNHYTEADVTAAAKVLTGWRVERETNRVSLDKAKHDQSDKQFSAFYNNKIIKGGPDAEREIREMINMIFEKEETALYICRKLYRFFGYYRIDNEIEANIIKPLADLLKKNNFQFLPVVSTLLNSEHFFDAANKGCYIKTPLDLVLGVFRNFNVTINGPKPYDQYQILAALAANCAYMQMLPGDPPNVAGWPAFRQGPGYYRTWINSESLRNRNSYTDFISYWRFESDSGYKVSIDHIKFAKQFPQPDDPNLYIDSILQILMPMPLSAAKKQTLKSILLSGQTEDYYWTIAWRNYIANPNDKVALDTVLFRLEALHRYLMGLPEYQLI